jgi:hypothetical protein
MPPVRASGTDGLILAALDGSAEPLLLRLSAVLGAVTALVAFTLLSGTAAVCVVRGAFGIGRDRGCLAAVVVVVFAGDVQAAQADLALGAVGRRVGDPEADRDRVAVVRDQLSSLLVRIDDHRACARSGDL